MGLLSDIGKIIKAVPRYLFSDGTTVITQARKGVRANNPGMGWSIFSGTKQKAQAGWEAFAKDIKNYKSKRTVWQSIQKFGKSFMKAPRIGLALAERAAKQAGKKPSFWMKAGKILKCYGSVFKKIPIIGTVLTIGFEAHDIISAFTHKEGGLWEGLKQIGKSALKLGVGALAGAAGTALLGPVGGAVAWMAADWLVNKVVGGSFSENHPDAPKGTEAAQSQAQQQEKKLTIDDLMQNQKTGDKSTEALDAAKQEMQKQQQQQDSAKIAADIAKIQNTSFSGLGMTTPPLINPTMDMGMNSPMFNGMNTGLYNPYSQESIDPLTGKPRKLYVNS